MRMTFRWFGPDDPVRLEQVRQIPGIHGIVSALHEIPAGDVWPVDAIEQRAEIIDAAGLRFEVVESVPIHEDIKLGLPTRDRFIDQFCESVQNLGRLEIGVLCYNFMPVFDWMRTRLDVRLPDGSTTLLFDQTELAAMDPLVAPPGLPAWPVSDGRRSLEELLQLYSGVTEEHLWENFEYFLTKVVPVAEASGVRLCIHPDDPPWSIFGLPRIIRDLGALERLLKVVDSPANGITFCTGSLGADPANDLPAMIRRLGKRIHFVHCRNVRTFGERGFIEVPQLSTYGDVDMREVLLALREVDFTGPVRPDHGRMIWGEVGRPGYGLFDRALGATYLQGLWEGLGPAASPGPQS